MKGDAVAYAIQVEVEGDKEAFERLDNLISEGPMPPEGLLAHVVRQTDDGFDILDVYRRPEEARDFLDERLRPALNELGLSFEVVSESPVWGLALP